MNNILACHLAMVLVATLIPASIARADLGTCFVLRSTDARLDGDVTQKARKAIIDAHQISDDSDGDMLFVLDIANRAHGNSYVVRNVKLVFGSWTLRGYKITGDNEGGLVRGVAEIVVALRDGAIYELKPGRRESTTSQEPAATDTQAVSFGLANTFSGQLSDKQKRAVPDSIRHAFMVESLKEITESVLDELLEDKTLVDEENRNGKRHVAVKGFRHVTFSDEVSGHMIVIERYLVTPNDPYETALIESLHLLAGRGEPRHIKAILKKHAPLVDARRRFTQPHKPARTDSFTPLQQAVDNARQDTVALLLNMGADVNRSDGLGWTPLHLAARRGHLAVVKLLVQHGADLDAETDAIPASLGVGGSSPVEKPHRESATPSMTPLDLAIKSRHADVVEYLKSISR